MNEGSREILHVVFTPSGAATLRQALKTLGRSDSVAAAFDDLSFGPIDPLDLPSRRAWIESELGWADYDIGAETNKFQREAFALDRRKIAWFSRRSAKEYAGFLAWLWQMEDAPCEVIDLTHAHREAGSGESRGPGHLGGTIVTGPSSPAPAAPSTGDETDAPGPSTDPPTS